MLFTPAATRARHFFPALLSLAATACLAAAPAPQRLLPDDTLVLVTAPDFSRVRNLARHLPQVQLWNDAAMKPFHDRFLAKWSEDFVKPLERELGVQFADYASLLQGQVTFALTLNDWRGQEDAPLGLLLLVDTQGKAPQLKKNLTQLRSKWAEAGRPLRTEKIRDREFTVLSVSTNDIPRTFRKFFPPSSPVQELPDESQPQKTAPPSELVIGQVDTLLIAGNSTKLVEKIVVRLAGGKLPALGDLAAYQANHLRLFRDAPLYGWINVKAFMDVWTVKAAQEKENSAAPNPFDIKPDRIAKALGLSGLKTLAFSLQDSQEGILVQAYAGVPESARQGIFKILAGEPKDANPPPFVPADAVKFQRWRLHGQKTWSGLEQLLSDLSPQAIGTLNFLLDSADAYAKERDPGFDIRKNLIGNLGDDVITYEKAPRGFSREELASPPRLFLIGSPNAEQMAAALKSVMVFLGRQMGSPPDVREFLGRKIYSVPLGPLPVSVGTRTRTTAGRVLHYAASGGYVGLSFDASILEEYLRTSEGFGKALGETPGLKEAAQHVLGPGTSLLGYENRLELTRTAFESLRREDASSNAPVVAASILSPVPFGIPNPAENFRGMMDCSLLPSFERIARYFSFTVYGGSATVDGLSLKVFLPVPPLLNTSTTASR